MAPIVESAAFGSEGTLRRRTPALEHTAAPRDIELSVAEAVPLIRMLRISMPCVRRGSRSGLLRADRTVRAGSRKWQHRVPRGNGITRHRFRLYNDLWWHSSTPLA